jgi:hypothetical protein
VGDSGATGTVDTARRVGFREVLGVAEFRSMWFAETLSTFGDQEPLERALSIMERSGRPRAADVRRLLAATYAPTGTP